VVAKIVEIRDRGTFIPALAVQMGSRDDQERWLLSSAGFGKSAEEQSRYVVLVKINGGEPCDAHIDPEGWGKNPRTYNVAHRWLQQHFSDVAQGQVIDVEYLLGEAPAPKVSDRYYTGASI
jgi:hypothetical protein